MYEADWSFAWYFALPIKLQAAKMEAGTSNVFRNLKTEVSYL